MSKLPLSIVILIASAITVHAQHAKATQITYSAAPISVEANSISNSGTVIINFGAIWNLNDGILYRVLSPMG